MATNISTINALKGFSKLIAELGIEPKQETIDEIKAWNRLLKYHLRIQGHQGGKWPKNRYEYDPKTKEIVRYNGRNEELRRY